MFIPYYKWDLKHLKFLKTDYFTVWKNVDRNYGNVVKRNEIIKTLKTF